MTKSFKKSDLIWGIGLLLVIFILTSPYTHKMFLAATKTHPYITGFFKVGILATMGELLAIRIVKGNYAKPLGMVYRFVIWGFIGMAFAVVFALFAGGVGAVMKDGLLPVGKEGTLANKILSAFFTSTFMNLAFAPTFMAFHRITDTYIDLGQGQLSNILKVKLYDVVENIDWHGYIGFVVCKTIPIFWIPAHTITFLLPSEYRVLTAALLSIVLGAILATSKAKTSMKQGNVSA